MKKQTYKRALAWLLVLCTVVLLTLSAAGCGEKAETAGSVYYLNFKPEQKSAWEALAKKYTEKTGIAVTVVTAASGTYEDTLSAEIIKDHPPTLFQVNGPVGLEHWKDYCYDLKDSTVYGQLTDNAFALTDGDRVLGIAYVLETYGIIYNKALLDRYFAAEWSTVKKVEDIRNFAALSKVATEIQAHKTALGVKGAFTSAGMTDSSDWRFKTHLANVPLYYEYRDKKITSAAEVSGTYLDRFRQMWDLYLNNATCSPTEVGSKTGDDAVSEFAGEEAVFYQNGTWSYGDITTKKITADQLGMLPIYIGVDGEETQGLCTGSENYWCVNKDAKKADIQATLDFLGWVVTSDEGTDALANAMGFTAPFKAAKPSANPLVAIANDYVKSGKTAVSWNFATMPSDDWKNGVGAAMLAYAQGGMTDAAWKNVVNAFVTGWKTEYAKNH